MTMNKRFSLEHHLRKLKIDALARWEREYNRLIKDGMQEDTCDRLVSAMEQLNRSDIALMKECNNKKDIDLAKRVNPVT